LKRKEFADLKQGGMTMNVYLNSFILLSRYAPDDINIDEKKQDVFLSGLNDDIQFQLLNIYYADFQHMVDKAITIENKIREMEKDGKRKVSFSGQSSGSNVRPRFAQPNQLFEPLPMNRPPMPDKYPALSFRRRGLSRNHLDPTGSNHLARPCSKALAPMPQPRTVHHLRETALVELALSVD
jgi:hypothetical protein